MNWDKPSDLACQALSVPWPCGASTAREVLGPMPDGTRRVLVPLLPSSRNPLFRVDLTWPDRKGGFNCGLKNYSIVLIGGRKRNRSVGFSWDESQPSGIGCVQRG